MNYLLNYSITLVLLVIIFSVSMFPGLVQASVVEITAEGVTRQVAIYNGLAEALGRVKGLELKTTREILNVLKEGMDVNSGLETDKTRFSSEQLHDIRAKTRGYITSYDVLGIRPRADGREGFEVNLIVHIPTYEPPGQNSYNRRKIAVVPFRNSRD